MNGSRLSRHLTTFLVIAGGLLLFAGPRAMAGGFPHEPLGQLTANPSPVTFGNIAAGGYQTLTVVLSNTGDSEVTVTKAALSGAGFSMSNLNMPFILYAGRTRSVAITFAPTGNGAFTGQVLFDTFPKNQVLEEVQLPLSGSGSSFASLVPNPSSLAFGSVLVNSQSSLSETVTNMGSTAVTISSAATSGPGFSVTGPALPVSVAANQSVSFTVTFAPTGAGAASGSLSVVANTNLNIPLSATGQAAGSLTANPTVLPFGNVQVGNSANLSETLTNTGGSPVTISQVNPTGPGFSMSGLALPLTLAANQSVTFTGTFNPANAGAANGNLSVVSNAPNSPLNIALSGTGMAAGALTANPTALAFGNVQVGNGANLSETLTNTGGSPVTISQANLTGSSFSITGLTLPLTLTANQSVTFTATFTPTSAGGATGSLSVVSTAPNSPLNIALSGTGTAAGKLAVSPASLSFGNVVVGSSSSLTGSLNATGAAVTITSASLNNSEFTLSGISLPATVGAGQSSSFTVTFTPQSSGATSASLVFSSNASNSPSTQSMTGTGTSPVQHTADLSWNAADNAVGYNVYRGTVSGGPYSMVNTSLDGTTNYADNTVVSGQTYYYVSTAVDANGDESVYSNETAAVIPTS